MPESLPHPPGNGLCIAVRGLRIRENDRERLSKKHLSHSQSFHCPFLFEAIYDAEMGIKKRSLRLGVTSAGSSVSDKDQEPSLIADPSPFDCSFNKAKCCHPFGCSVKKACFHTKEPEQSKNEHNIDRSLEPRDSHKYIGQHARRAH